MSRYKRDLSLANAGEVEREQVVFRNQAHNGQHPETEAIYRDAILACQSIDNLELTVTDIAREYDLKPECLRNQLKRHFPEIFARREQIRDMLGLSRPGNRGLKKATVEKYADAIQMLRNTSLTVKEVANRCNVSYSGLQQHLICYHKDIAESRLLYRADALLQTVPSDTLIGSPSAIGGSRQIVFGNRPERSADSRQVRIEPTRLGKLLEKMASRGRDSAPVGT